MEREKKMLIRAFKARGGVPEPFCTTESTQYLVASTWTEIEDHFRDMGDIKFPGLLDHFIGHLHIVSYDWVYFSILEGRVLDSYTYELHPKPHESIKIPPRVFENALDYELSTDELQAVIDRYETTQISQSMSIEVDT